MIHMFGNFLNLKNKIFLAKVLRSLDGSLPRKIDVSKFGELYKCYAYDSRKIIGWSLREDLTHKGPEDALKMALKQRKTRLQLMINKTRYYF